MHNNSIKFIVEIQAYINFNLQINQILILNYYDANIYVLHNFR